MMKTTIYADNAATTRLDQRALEAMLPWLQEEYGNASQPYSFSRGPKKALREARMADEKAKMAAEREAKKAAREARKAGTLCPV